MLVEHKRKHEMHKKKDWNSVSSFNGCLLENNWIISSHDHEVAQDVVDRLWVHCWMNIRRKTLNFSRWKKKGKYFDIPNNLSITELSSILELNSIFSWDFSSSHVADTRMQSRVCGENCFSENIPKI